MNRRDFFRRGLPGLALAGVPLTAAAPLPDPPDETEIGGLRCRWLGWRERPSQDSLYGVWVLGPIPGEQGDIGLYSCTGGYVGQYRSGEVFNTAVRRTENWVDSRTDDATKVRIRREAFERLQQAFAEGTA